MNDHLGISEEKFASLNLSIKDVIKVLPLVGPGDETPKMKGSFVQKPFTYVNLLHYIDNCGPSFMIGQPEPRHKIAKAIFDKCDNARKVIVYSYIEWYEEQLP